MAIGYSLLLEEFSSVTTLRIAAGEASCRATAILACGLKILCMQSEELATRMQLLDSALDVTSGAGSAQAVWYSGAMHRKSSALFALLLGIILGVTAAAGQAVPDPPADGQNASGAGAAPRTPTAPRSRTNASSSPAATPAGAASHGDSESGAADDQPAHITIATPAPAAAPWPWQDRIAWAANLVLVVLGYAGILLAVSALKKIERQTQYAEAAAQAAADSAQAALLHAQALERAERPWILVTIEPSHRVENRFMVMATNRGRRPARILSAVDKITIQADQAALPEEPQYDDAEPNASLAAVILLPGESTGIKAFGRDDVAAFCETEERLQRVEKWEELILLYGKVVYEDLVSTGDAPTRETAWCCWYIHGRQNSGMVTAGSAAYNRHS
jgi:hypothetical protein